MVGRFCNLLRPEDELDESRPTWRDWRRGDVRCDYSVFELVRCFGESLGARVPIAVVDALFSGDGESLNLEGAVEELANLRGDIVRVDEEDTKVRIWIDEKD